jgi:glycosyltransferase involved in cell wall biosynthesis
MNATRSPLRVGLDARLTGGAHGGIEQVLIGLALGLSKLTDGNEEYLFLVRPGQDDWIRPYLKGPCQILVQGEPPEQASLGRRVQRVLRWKAPILRTRWQRRWAPPTAGREEGLRQRGEGFVPLEASDRTVESAGVDVMHFPHQTAFLTSVPTIYQPHDLQHLHFPELFTDQERASRELRYRTYCEEAVLVVMMTSWGKDDLVTQYGVPAEKVAVVNWGSVLDAYPTPTAEDLAEARVRLSLPESFILYPAQTWPHKNHELLLEALAAIRDRDGVTIPLVCSGKLNEHSPEVKRRVAELGLEEAVTFTGFVTPLELRSLYATATALVFPSRFEGWGMPISEAFASGVPVASSSATGLREVVGDAGLLFDPDDRDQIADAMRRLWDDPELRQTLADRGLRRAGQFSIERAGRIFRAHYRRIAGRTLSAEDRDLLNAPPLA